jgi:DNA-binding MarR family transcriptional regulator
MTSKLTPEMRASVNAALETLQAFREVDPEMPIGAARSFLLIATEQGLSVTDLKARGGNALSSASRYHRYLGDADRRGRPGMGLVKASQSHEDTRRKALRLTPKGRRLMGQLEVILRSA